MRGKPIYDAEGHAIGDIDEVYCDGSTGEAQWVVVAASRRAVPVHALAELESGAQVHYDSMAVYRSPELAGDEIPAETVAALYETYEPGRPRARHTLRRWRRA
jgi:hypothetical protein